MPKKDKSLGQDGKPKWFTSLMRAQTFIATKGLSATHKPVEKDDKYYILPKE